MVDIQNHEGNGASVLYQFFVFTHKHAAEARTVQATRQRVFLAGLFVFALLDFQGLQVLFQFLALFLVGSPFTAVVEEADNQDNEEGHEPDSDDDGHQVCPGNLLSLEAEAADFHGAVAQGSVGTRLDFDKGHVGQVHAGLVHVDFVLGHPPARHAEFLGHEHRRVGFF